MGRKQNDATPPADHNRAPLRLRGFVDRLVHLEEEKRELASAIKDVKNEASSEGFDKRALAQMVKEAMMTPEQRAAQREHEEICEVFRANLGMLGDTPLGDAARRRAAAPYRDPGDDDEPETPDKQAEPESPPMPPEDIDAAREKGRVAASDGEKIFGNPYTHGDPRRAAWDEGFCESAGHDGMQIPDAWRRKPKPRASKPEKDAA